MAVAVAAVLGIVGGVVAVAVLRGPEQVAAPPVVMLEPWGDSGPDPFLGVAPVDPVVAVDPAKGVEPVKDFADPVKVVVAGSAASMTLDDQTGTLSTAGTTRNLYGGANGQSTELFGGSGILAKCDISKLADFLATNPDKARAWAEVRRTAPEQILAYLQGLIPVVLLRDTLVTNFGFSNGVATPRLSVLQAGTGVLVDATGQPVVRCACGNPLTAPAAVNLPTAELQGTRWDGYDPAQAVVVRGAPPAAGLVLVDVVSGASYNQPVGGAAVSTSSTPPTPTSTAPPGADCQFDLGPPFSGPAWVDATVYGTDYTCTEMIAQWGAYEQWPGEREGNHLQSVDFPDGSRCELVYTPIPQYGTEEDTGAIGVCNIGNRGKFAVWQGEFGQHINHLGIPVIVSKGADGRYRSVGPATTVASKGTGTAGSTAAVTSGDVVTQDSLVTPSGNITCAIIDGHFHCTIQNYDFALGPCESENHPFISLEATGPASMSPCIGDAFVGAGREPSTYGARYQLGDIVCDVEETGVRCTNPEGSGFTLNRAAFAPFSTTSSTPPDAGALIVGSTGVFRTGSTMPDSMVGTWAGLMNQPSFPPYHTVVHLASQADNDGHIGTVEYTELKCSGDLTMVEVRENSLVLSDFLTISPNCVSAAFLTLAPQDDGSIKDTITYGNAYTAPVATGFLNKSD